MKLAAFVSFLAWHGHVRLSICRHNTLFLRVTKLLKTTCLFLTASEKVIHRRFVSRHGFILCKQNHSCVIVADRSFYWGKEPVCCSNKEQNTYKYMQVHIFAKEKTYDNKMRVYSLKNCSFPLFQLLDCLKANAEVDTESHITIMTAD